MITLISVSKTSWVLPWVTFRITESDITTSPSPPVYVLYTLSNQIVRAINGGPHNDGLIVVADDSTVEFGGAAGSKTAVYLDSDIVTMGAVTVAAANS